MPRGFLRRRPPVLHQIINAHTPRLMREGYNALLKPFDDKTFSCGLQRFYSMQAKSKVVVPVT
jgi:hypothetical protein